MKETEAIKTELNRFVENVFLSRLTAGAVAVIRERTLKGEFSEGDSRYSTKPFAMPVGGLTKQLRARITRESKKNSDQFSLFTSKAGNLWVVVAGGYHKIRELAGKDVSNVSLSWTGRMMGDLAPLKTEAGKDGLYTKDVGFKSKEQEQKAMYHNILGAGKSKKKHVFMYLTKTELDKLVDDALS